MKVGVFGGSFNPPHNGHIVISVFSIEYLKLDKLLIIPSYTPPHREKPSVSFDTRVEMLKLVFNKIPKCEISTIEKDLNISYTYDVIKELRKNYPNDDMFLIIGYDQYAMKNKWYRWNDITNMVNVAVYPRGDKNITIEKDARLLPSPLIDISSSMIRDRLSQGLLINGMVDSVILEFIDKNNLYRR